MKKIFSFFLKFEEKIFILALILFSLFINKYYGNRGVFPIDSFSHFDTGFRILLGEFPFKDFWVISGPFVDYLQAFFFYFFGVSWQSYILHASLVNVLIVVITFLVLRSFKLNIYLASIYSFSLAILAYPSSGTPFVDHHSTFLSLLGVYALIIGIKNKSKVSWILLPIFLVFAFLSKQVPASYVTLSIIIILLFYTLINKEFYWIKYSFLSTFFIISIIFIIGKVQGINFISFLNQYIFYPQTLGNDRYEYLKLDFKNVLIDFKYIYLSVAILFYLNIKRIFTVKNYLKENDFYFFLIIILLMISLIAHQLLTRNQIYIFFLIPILLAFSHIYIIKFSKLNNILVTLMILLCLFSTYKYHYRFNHERKFHELNNVNFSFGIKGDKIDKKFLGLVWITPEYKNNVNKEIILIKDTKLYLAKDNRTKMVITNYSFFSALLNQKLFSPIRWFVENGVSHPLKDNKYFNHYESFIINKIKDNKIKVIYTIKPVPTSYLQELLGYNCIKTLQVNDILNAHSVLNCDKLN